MKSVLLAGTLFAACISFLIGSEASSDLILSNDIKVAILITIAGKKKLSNYFDWTCTTIGRGNGMFDLVVFHEGNELILDRETRGTCASNVRFINLGEYGLSNLIGTTFSFSVVSM